MKDTAKYSNMYTIINLVRGLNKAIDDDCRISASKVGVTVSQQHLLCILSFENGSTLSDISEYGLWHLSTVMDLVDRMERAELVRKEVDKKDARTKRVYITEKGQEALSASNKNLANFKFLNIIESLHTEELIQRNIGILYELNKAIHGENFVRFVEQSSKKF